MTLRSQACTAVGVAPAHRFEPWLTTVQRVLDGLPGPVALLTPVRDRTGRLVDLIYAAVSPEAFRADGRHGQQLLGERLAEPIAGDRWLAYQHVLDTGVPAVLGPFGYRGARWSVRVHRLGDGLLTSWLRHDARAVSPAADAGRLAEVERQLAEQCRTLAAEHELAARLQQIILPLPGGPIELPGLKVALRYLPAGDESLVGGDWYHAGELRDGSVLLAVGDVAGHGIQAATTMAQLRHALRALAVTTNDPGVLLGHLNRLTCDLDRETPETTATAVVARYEPNRRRLSWAQAGHPPPLLSRGGRTAPLTRPPGPMLGVVDNAGYATSSLDMYTGDVLLFYTDGLVEHRRHSLDAGLATVIAAVDEAVAASPEQPLGELLSRLHRANPDDDTCILACRPATGETRDLRRFLAEPTRGGKPQRAPHAEPVPGGKPQRAPHAEPARGGKPRRAPHEAP